MFLCGICNVLTQSQRIPIDTCILLPDVNDERNGVATVATILRNGRSPRPTMTVIRRLLFTPAEMLAPMGPAWNPADPPRVSPKPTWALALRSKQKRVSHHS